MSLEAIDTNTEFSAPTFPKQDYLARLDIKEGLTKWRLWWMLAYQDIKLRYRRSILGPFWITLSMAITVYTMGYLYGHLFHMDLQTYFPFLVAGMLAWALISTTLSELTEAFTTHEGIMKQIKLPFSLYIHRVILRNVIIFLHNLLVIIPILLIFREVAKVNLYTLLLIPGLFIIYLNALCYGIVLALIGARYRDISQMTKSLIQITFFVTPIMWHPRVLPESDRYLVLLNPFYSYIELIRAPLMGHAPTLFNLAMVFFITILGITLSAKMFIRYRARIVYWI